MISLLELDADDRVLEIGAGSGYAAALLGQIVREVHTVERIKELVKYARERLQLLGYNNIHVHRGDGTLGWEPEAPYDGIVVAAGGPSVPDSLKRQLAENGRLIIPVGRTERQQNLIRVIKTGENEFEESDLGAVAFVPLIGDEGW
jgi:protein-L-isoaspartate(D-aspartate) O-methyltransferase